ncbi:glycoside hydrolase superfamily [Lasiosphaeria miniovina]|uniref:Glycoside hydrolase superfamily n=1 Tax=Lasiosphaeria miniovina TaxID=1954250 RepID=A0AA40B4R4_9PEZI|nr:glycoside hydrolase superfamily [Lasiosphaeria miniovina]KAK0727720.1 glycoside hydrolase superfamily [Lasiosphaeria miniovina]
MRIKDAVVLGFATSQFVAAGPASSSKPTKKGSLSPISAQDWIKAASPGWNAGNTLDATPNEGSWNNPPLQGSTLDHVKAAGFKSVRIPVTYTEHFTTGSPSWTINSTWLQRVSDVIDMATSRGLYVITNMHHDSWGWVDVSKPDANQTMIQEKFYAAWLQIGKTLHCKSSLVAFEPINEPPGNNAADGANLNKLNGLFIKALADSGNSKRVVTLSGLGMSIDKIQWFKAPENMTNPWAFQFHFYSPCKGKTVWGSDADKAAIDADLLSVRGNFTDVPLLMGEFSASQLNCEAAARWKWYDYVVRKSTALGITTMLWDNGLDNLARESGEWRDHIAVDIITSTVKGVNNSLADSTVDASATSQTSSAYIFNKVGSALADQTLSFLLNGNTFKSLAVGGVALRSGEDYTISGSSVTFKGGFLTNYLSANAVPGTKANVTVEFSAGAPSQVELVQWDVPALASYSSAAKSVPTGSDLWVPIVWKGLHKVAAVAISTSDGAYLVDDWTKWLPPLQQGRGTFNSQWNFDFDHFTITSQAVSAVIAAGKNATFTIEFYPRRAGNENSVEYTLTV